MGVSVKTNDIRPLHVAGVDRHPVEILGIGSNDSTGGADSEHHEPSVARDEASAVFNAELSAESDLILVTVDALCSSNRRALREVVWMDLGMCESDPITSRY